MISSRHSFYCVGQWEGWQGWVCDGCETTAIPSGLGFLWPDLGAWLWPSRWGCRAMYERRYADQQAKHATRQNTAQQEG